MADNRCQSIIDWLHYIGILIYIAVLNSLLQTWHCDERSEVYINFHFNTKDITCTQIQLEAIQPQHSSEILCYIIFSRKGTHTSPITRTCSYRKATSQHSKLPLLNLCFACCFRCSDFIAGLCKTSVKQIMNSKIC